MTGRGRIEINPEVLDGKPVVKGTRLSVELILEMVAAGVPEAEILDNYPHLGHDDLLACVAYAVERQEPTSPFHSSSPRRRRIAR